MKAKCSMHQSLPYLPPLKKTCFSGVVNFCTDLPLVVGETTFEYRPNRLKKAFSLEDIGSVYLYANLRLHSKGKQKRSKVVRWCDNHDIRGQIKMILIVSDIMSGSSWGNVIWWDKETLNWRRVADFQVYRHVQNYLVFHQRMV